VRYRLSDPNNNKNNNQFRLQRTLFRSGTKRREEDNQFGGLYGLGVVQFGRRLMLSHLSIYYV
jgi:hypothetical protein